ncbi:organic solute transporter subunit alpha-like isoform X1 [Macrobrachium nipponense]|uniref:organic solute transporter subunit alpha-like isoform X1 n=2 Tax=Macrobrachium nipponense TaxID=159736 RepID=UPI0030C81A9F
MEDLESFNTSDYNATVNTSNYSIAASSECSQDILDFEPSFTEFLEALGIAGWMLVGFATAAFLLLIILYVDTLAYVIKYTQPRHKATTAIVLSVYPVIGLCSYLGLLFQKANTFLDASAQVYFAVCMWQFLVLTLNYFGGESRFVAKMEGSALSWKGPPCCCWPCCVCPSSRANKRQIRFVKILVMQHTWVQIVVSIFQVTLWLEGWYTHLDMRPNNGYIYIYPVATTSFGFALWAFIVGFKSSLRHLREFYYVPKIVAFQLCLFFLRLQAIIVNSILVPSGAFPCLPPISPKVFANTFLNALLMGQLVFLSALARHYYKKPIPDVVTLPFDTDSKENYKNGDFKAPRELTPVGEKGLFKGSVRVSTPSQDKDDGAPLLDKVITRPPPPYES